MELFTYIRILIPKFKFLHEFRKWLVYVQISSFLGRQKQNIFLFSEKGNWKWLLRWWWKLKVFWFFSFIQNFLHYNSELPLIKQMMLNSFNNSYCQFALCFEASIMLQKVI